MPGRCATLDGVLTAVEKVTGVPRDRLTRPLNRRGSDEERMARGVAILMARKHTEIADIDLGVKFNCDRSQIVRKAREIAQALDSDQPSIKALVAGAVEDLISRDEL